MLKVIWKKIFIILILFFLLFICLPGNNYIVAEENSTSDSQQIQDLKKRIEELQGKVTDLQGQEKTLSSQIAVMDSQIELTQARIDSTKQQILELTANIDTTNKKIGDLQKSLNELMNVLIKRIIATYEVGSAPSFQVLLSSTSVSNLFTKLNYLKIAQAHDKQLIYSTQQAKVDYVNQKDIFQEKKEKVESLKKELEAYTVQLDQEKLSRQSLLDITMNDEQKYQQLLAQARAEYEAILGITAGRGTEVEVGKISEGSKIATIISGASACSTGTHLHFQVTSGGSVTNPASYLSSKDVDWDLCGWYGCDSQFSFTGSWRWPIEGRPRITQGYGMTAYASTGAYGGGQHTGVDMLSEDLSIKAVKEGTLYKGSIACGGGSLLYVRVQQSDGTETYYLHVYPN